jgi:hypothetical protein
MDLKEIELEKEALRPEKRKSIQPKFREFKRSEAQACR